MPSVPRRPLPRIILPLAATLLIGGCQLQQPAPVEDTLPRQGVQHLRGLAQPVTVHRDGQGLTRIEGANLHDGLFTLGYLHASDRLPQMISLRLLAEGRLAELEGVKALALDRLLRALDLRRSAGELLRSASPQMRQMLEVYARGVNAALFAQRERLPGALSRLQPMPAYWQAEDSALLFCLLDLALSGNLQDELAALWLMDRVDRSALFALLSGDPEQPAQAEEQALLEEPALRFDDALLGELLRSLQQLTQQAPSVQSTLQVAVHATHSRGGRSLLALDSRHIGSHSPWYAVQLTTPRYKVAGAGLPGLPLLLNGFNGQLAWSLGSIRADTQDLAIERLRPQGTQIQYRHQDGQWRPLAVRPATFFIHGQRPRHELLYASDNGPLLHDPKGRQHALALRRPPLAADRSLDALFALSRAADLEQAHAAAREVRTPAVHLLYADAASIAWQVAGRYPNRLAGRGLLPVPGWQAGYRWDGYADSMLHPYDQDPVQGWLLLAGQRSVAAGYGVQMAGAWQPAQVAEQLAQSLGKAPVGSEHLAALLQHRTAPRLTLLERLAQPGALQALPEDKARALQRALAEQLPDQNHAHAGLRLLVDFSRREPLQMWVWHGQRGSLTAGLPGDAPQSAGSAAAVPPLPTATHSAGTGLRLLPTPR